MNIGMEYHKNESTRTLGENERCCMRRPQKVVINLKEMCVCLFLNG